PPDKPTHEQLMHNLGREGSLMRLLCGRPRRTGRRGPARLQWGDGRWRRWRGVAKAMHRRASVRGLCATGGGGADAAVGRVVAAAGANHIGAGRAVGDGAACLRAGDGVDRGRTGAAAAPGRTVAGGANVLPEHGGVAVSGRWRWVDT